LTEPTGVGARLRQAREAQGLAIDDVALQLKFAPRQIESLEAERFDRLPGPTIARGMVRNYARLLKLDPEPLVERMPYSADATRNPAKIAERFEQEVPFSEGGRRSTFLYAGFSIGILVLVGLAAYQWQREDAAPQFVAPARKEPAAAAPEVPSEPIVAQAPPVAAEPAPPQPPVAAEKRPEEPKLEEKKAQPARAAAAATDKVLAQGTHRLVLHCSEEAWLEVKDGSGRTVVAGLYPAGAERVVRGDPPFELVIGNAASVRVTYNGKPVDLRPHTRVEVARLTLK
jgi:cytoskeleton protein RodZ